MAFEREYWSLPRIGRWTSLPCPHCERGWLKFVPDSLNRVLAPWREKQRQEHVEFEWVDAVFTCTLRCDGQWCGELVMVSGKGVTYPYQDENGEMDFEERLEPRSMVPSPNIFTYPKATPQIVQLHLKRSFSLFWVDLGAAANALRTSVERLLDGFDIPKRVNLSARIEIFGQKYPELKSILDACRYVGNTGSHDGSVERSQLLEAFEVVDHALDELFSGKKQRLQQIVERLLQNKGKGVI